MADLNQITVNVKDIIPPDNFATVDTGVKIGSVYTKEQDNAWRKEVEENTNSGIKGVAKPDDTVPTTGFFRMLANTADTYTNYLDDNDAPIVVTADDLNIVNGVQRNEVIIEVTNGVAEKKVFAKVGADGANGTATIPQWVAGDYSPDAIVLKDFVQYIAPNGASATDIPNEKSEVWVYLNDLSKDRVVSINELKNNVFDNSLYDFGQTNSTPSNFIVNQFTPSENITINRLLFNVFTDNSLVNKIQIFEFSTANQGSISMTNILHDFNVTSIISDFGHGYYEAVFSSKVTLQAGKIYAFRIGNLTTSINKSAILQTYTGSKVGLSNLGFTNSVNTGNVTVQYSLPYWMKPLLFKLIEDVVVEGFNSKISDLNDRVTILENEIPNPSTPLKYDAIGDSITFGHPTNNALYRASIGNPSQIDSYAKVASEIIGLDFNNLGISSSRLATDPNSSIVSMVDRLDTVRNDANIVSIMGGTNDRAQGVPLGVFGDNVSTTFYGALRLISERLIKRFWVDQNRDVKIFFCTFPKSATSQTSNIAMDFSSQLLYRDAILKNCDAFGFPVFDMWKEADLSPHTMRTFANQDGNLFNPFMPDGAHPAIDGHRRAGIRFANFIENIL